MKATLSNYNQTPRKTRLVADLVRGKSVTEALTILTFLEKRAAGPMQKLIRSAIANAEKQGESAAALLIQAITVDKGIVRVKPMARAQGRTTPLRSRHSHITVTLGKGKAKK